MTIVILRGSELMTTVSKSKAKARILEYFRAVERTGKELIITDRGRPVLKLVPYRPDPGRALQALRGSVVRYDDPAAPVGEGDWEALS
jgi:prevent-host-death family protein